MNQVLKHAAILRKEKAYLAYLLNRARVMQYFTPCLIRLVSCSGLPSSMLKSRFGIAAMQLLLPLLEHKLQESNIKPVKPSISPSQDITRTPAPALPPSLHPHLRESLLSTKRQ